MCWPSWCKISSIGGEEGIFWWLGFFCFWWFGDVYLKKMGIWWFWEVVVMVIELFLSVIWWLFQIWSKSKKGAENCHFLTETSVWALKNVWWFEAFCLVIGDLRGHLVMVIWAIFCWWYGDLSHFLLVIWWLRGGTGPPPTEHICHYQLCAVQ